LNGLFSVPEQGFGSYRALGILRWAMVLIFVTFGIQKFNERSAAGIVPLISHSPFVWWLSSLGTRGEAYLLGTIEFTVAFLLATGAFVPLFSAVGSLLGMLTFAVTWSFFFTTPGVVMWRFAADPIVWNLTGAFLFKDIVLLCVCLVLFVASLSRLNRNGPDF